MSDGGVPDAQAFEELTQRFMKVQLHIMKLRAALRRIRELRQDDSEIVDLIDEVLRARPD